MYLEIQDVLAMQSALKQLCVFLSENRVSPERIFDSRLVASELVGNVLKHAGESAQLTWGIKGNVIELAVRSKSGFCPPKESICSSVYCEHGRGLFLVDSLCERRYEDGNGGIVVTIKMQ